MTENWNKRWDDNRACGKLNWTDADKADLAEALQVPGVRTWRQRIDVGKDWPLHAPNDVERAMVAEIAELRLAAAKVEAPAQGEILRLQRLLAHKDGQITALTAKAAQQAAAPGALDLLNAEELAALHRFQETCEDSEGYDVGKDMMKRLAAIGVIESKGFNRYQFTEFGDYVVENRAPSAPGTPEAPAELPRLYRFDCYVGKTKMAAGVGVHATSMTEAEEKAKKLADKDETIKFESNRPCHATRKCSICAEYERAAQLDGGQGEGP